MHGVIAATNESTCLDETNYTVGLYGADLDMDGPVKLLIRIFICIWQSYSGALVM